VLERPELELASEVDAVASPEGSVVLERLEPELTSEAAAPVATSAPGTLPAAVLSAVRALPNRPRVRASFSYNHDDRMTVEVVLMNERRELLHRFAVHAEPGGALARIFEALVGVAMASAAEAGVFGARK
jgi:hypothetical protein